MDVVAPRICERHKKNADHMCTKYECFLNADILICPECSTRHFEHRDDIIQISLLNEKVRELMNKRVQFESSFESSCQLLINELKKFKAFKEEIVTSLNIRERILNDLCKNIRRNLPYEKDKQLFKKHFGYIYLTMKGINPNVDIYNKFCAQVNETIAGCRKSIRKYELNWAQVDIPQLMKKEHQIGNILKRSKQEEEPKLYYPKFDKFKKQTIKLKDSSGRNARLLKINSEEFLSIQGDCLSWYNTSNFLFPKVLPIGKKLSNAALMGKNAFITSEEAGIFIYDMIHEKLLKQYASSNHKNALITGLLSLNNSTVLNFITCPNQIVSLRYNEESGSLKVYKGVQTSSKHIEAKVLDHNFVSLYDNKVVTLYDSQHLEKQRQYVFESLMKSTAKITENCFATGGECDTMYLMDVRDSAISMKMRVGNYCNQMSQIYPYCVMATCAKSIKIYDIRAQKELFSNVTDQPIQSLEVLNSETFVVSGSSLTVWSSVATSSRITQNSVSV